MWEQNWGTMVWGGGVQAVPALGAVGLFVVVVALVVAGLWQIARKERRVVGVLVLGLAALVPLSARALVLPHTFVNGTVADANQVNANFQALRDGMSAGAATQVFLRRTKSGFSVGAGPTNVATFSLPPGTYVLYGKVFIGSVDLECFFKGVGVDAIDGAKVQFGGANEQRGDSVIDMATKNPGDDPVVTLTCIGPGNVWNPQVMAVRANITPM